MATTKIPRASDWKTLVQKYSLKDNGLLKALAQCEKLSDDPDEATKVLDLVLKLAATLAKDKQVVAQKDVVEFLDDVRSAVERAKKDIGASAKKQVKA